MNIFRQYIKLSAGGVVAGREEGGETDWDSLVQFIPVSLARQKGTIAFTGPSPNSTGEWLLYRFPALKPMCTMETAVHFWFCAFEKLHQPIKSTEITSAEQPCRGSERCQQAYLHWRPSHSQGTPSFFARTLASGSTRGEQRTFYSYNPTHYTSLAFMRFLG